MSNKLSITKQTLSSNLIEKINDEMWTGKYREVFIFTEESEGLLKFSPSIRKANIYGISFDPKTCGYLFSIKMIHSPNIDLSCFKLIQHVELFISDEKVQLKQQFKSLDFLSSVILTGKGSIEYEHGMFYGISMLKISCGIANPSDFRQSLLGSYFVYLCLPVGYQNLAVCENEYVYSTK